VKKVLIFFERHVSQIIIILLLSILTLCYIFAYDFKITIWHFFISTLVAFIVGIAFKFLYDHDYKFSKSDEFIEDGKHQIQSKISDTIKLIFTQNFGEFIFLSVILTLVLVLIGALIENIKYVNPDSLTPTIITLLLSLFSVMVTVLGMHYAFLAERRARFAEENSQKLLEEKGQFLPHFSGFIQRINRKINCTNGLLIDLQQEIETNFYFVKCMFLTPFLGHAGITSGNISMARNINTFQSGISSLIQNPCCNVSMIIPEPESLVRWYAEIQWVEIIDKMQSLMAKKDTKIFRHTISKTFPELGDINDELFKKFYDLMKDFIDWKKKNKNYNEINNEIIKKLLKIIVLKKSKESLGIFNEKSELITYVKSFKDFSEEYKINFENKLQISFSNSIPFQMFLVTRPIIEKPHLFPNEESFRKKDGNIEEEGKFVVVSYVGDKTYSSLIEQIKRDESGITTNGGIKNLLQNLHSAFYSEDPRLCEILNNHYKHYFDSENSKHFPEIDPAFWENEKLVLIQ